MTTAAILLCWYLLTGLFIVAVCDVIFVRDGYSKLCFSRKEIALLAVGWPYFVFGALLGWD